MAKFNSLVFNEVSGSMGSMVLGKNGTARRKVMPADPRTAPQQAVRNSFTAASNAWKLLSAAQQAGWAALARQITLTNAVGKAYSPTGRRLYMSCFQNSHTVGQAAPADAPAFVPGVPAITDFAAVVTPPAAGHLSGQITLSGGFASRTDALVVRATARLSPDRNSLPPGAYRVLLALPANGTMPTPDALAALYAARFGAPLLGSKIAFAAFQTDANGFVGPVAQAVAIAGATAEGVLLKAA